MSLHDPVAEVKIVDVLLDDVITAEPVNVKPIVKMILWKCHPLFTLTIPYVACVEVSVEGHDIPEFAVMNSFDKVGVVKYMSAVETGK
jgi:hypothetical protein